MLKLRNTKRINSVVDTCPKGILPNDPTDSEPCSEDKIIVMQKRLENGEDLFHPHDNKICTTPEVKMVPGIKVVYRKCRPTILVSTHVGGVKVQKRFPIYDYDKAIKYLENIKNNQSNKKHLALHK